MVQKNPPCTKWSYIQRKYVTSKAVLCSLAMYDFMQELSLNNGLSMAEPRNIRKGVRRKRSLLVLEAVVVWLPSPHVHLCVASLRSGTKAAKRLHLWSCSSLRQWAQV
mmetsp:Transcript_36632/g.68176  ORF Transcript_36632/g.68176 Transcript_36632/m.68176 type:complete len:108 (-) Transcript_36632:41-364(-)